MLTLFTVGFLCLQVIAPYFSWFSKWNVPAHMGFGFCVTAYIVPGILGGVWSAYPDELLYIYFWINLLGAVGICFGAWFGRFLGYPRSIRGRLLRIFSGRLDEIIVGRSDKLLVMGITGMLVAYVAMGFVPMFAEDPYSAKQFKGEYRDPYYRVAYLFRFSFSVLVALVPIALAVWWGIGRRVSLFFSIAAVCLIAASLARASTALGVIAFLGVLAASYKGYFKWYMIFVLIIYPLGSGGYLILAILLDRDVFAGLYEAGDIARVVSSGSPDIVDQLEFLDGFNGNNFYSYGRTMVGGLVPGNYAWNPSVWTLTYDSVGADISNTVSGGLRLSPGMWGYANFGWIGAFVIPLFSGLIIAVMFSVIKRLPLHSSVLGASIVISLYLTLGKQLSEYYILSIHSLPSIACLVYLSLWYVRVKIR